MQNRRIIDRALQKASAGATVMLESNSMIVLFSHIQFERWSSIMPEKLTHIFGLPRSLRPHSWKRTAPSRIRSAVFSACAR
jgi:hypothetical protein